MKFFILLGVFVFCGLAFCDKNEDEWFNDSEQNENQAGVSNENQAREVEDDEASDGDDGDIEVDEFRKPNKNDDDDDVDDDVDDEENDDIEDPGYYPKCHFVQRCRPYKKCRRVGYPVCKRRRVCNKYILKYAKTCKKVCRKSYRSYGYGKLKCHKQCAYNKPVYKRRCRYFRKCKNKRRLVCKKIKKCHKVRVCKENKGYY